MNIHRLYASFNARDIPSILPLLHPNVHWPNGWEGGYVDGPDQVKAYWLRQWQALDPTVNPEKIEELPDGRVKVTVHQVVKDLQGNVLNDGYVIHVYAFDNDLITTMEIES